MNKRHGKPVDYRSFRYSGGDVSYLSSLVGKSERMWDMIKPTRWESQPVACPCGGKSEPIGERHMRCECGHIHAAAVRSAAAVRHMYDSFDEYNAHYVQPAEQPHKLETIYKPKAEYVRGFIKADKPNIMDVGAGAGAFLSAFGDASRKVAVEVSEHWRRWMEDAYGWARGNTYPSIQPFPMFDLVTAWCVIEHVVDPARIVHDMAYTLRPGGALVIEVPRAQSVSTALFLQRPGFVWRHMTSDHLHLFSDAALFGIIERAGLEIEEAWYYGLDALTVAVTNNLPIANCAATQEQIDEAEESDAMVVVARKR